jgi:short-subunit dehydrogenase
MSEPRTALITGAASGIGRRFAETLAERGTNLILWDVDAGLLEEVGERLRARLIRVVTARVDVSDPSAIERALSDDATAAQQIHLLVNCAAILGGGKWLEQPPQEFERVLRVDLLGTVATIRTTLPALKRAGGRAVVIASTAAIHGWPQLVAYSAAKFALVGFCEAVRVELEREGVGLTMVFPLLIDTPLVSRPGTPPILRRGRRIPPQVVVDKTLAAVERGKRRVYVPASTRFVAILHSIAPAILDWVGERFGMEDSAG